MPGFICARCLARPIMALPINRLARNPFSTTAVASHPAVVPKKKTATIRQGTPQWQMKGKEVKKTSRIAPGERKAFRKRVVLSNVNALEVPGLQTMTADSVTSQSTPGQILSLPDVVIDALRTNGTFKSTQSWNLFRQPATLVRQETIDLAKKFESVDSVETRPPSYRQILVGARRSGKSLLMLQAQAMALLKGWVVVHITDTNALTNGNTAYAPNPADEDSPSPTYVQPTATAALLQQIAKTNETVLSGLQLSQRHNLSIPLQENMTLHRLADLGATDPQLAWPIYQALWTELLAPNRPPVLFCVDGLAPLLAPTAYASPPTSFADVESNKALKPLHAQDFTLARHVVDVLKGSTEMNNGGIALFEDTQSNRPANAVLDFAIRRFETMDELQRQARSRGKSELGKAAHFRDPVLRALEGVDERGVPEWNGLVKCDRRAMQVVDSLRLAPNTAVGAGPAAAAAGVRVLRIGGLDLGETKSALEYYAKSGLLKEIIDARYVSEKWTVTGGGLVGELERTCLRRVI